MSDDRPDLSIDLHKLAAQNGEGLAPELFALFDHGRNFDNTAENVVALLSPDLPFSRLWSDTGPGDRDNIIAFPPGTGKTSGG